MKVKSNALTDCHRNVNERDYAVSMKVKSNALKDYHTPVNDRTYAVSTKAKSNALEHWHSSVTGVLMKHNKITISAVISTGILRKYPFANYMGWSLILTTMVGL